MADEEKEKMQEDQAGGEEAAAAGESGKAEEPQEAEEEEGITEEELKARLEEHFRKQKVEEMMVQFMVSLSTMAYVKMGITEDTQKYRDFEQARLAIDSFKAVLDAVGGQLEEQDNKALAGALASMQMTFAKAAGGETGGNETSKESKAEDNGSSSSSRLWVPGKE